jgi:hypothetical protein
MARIAMNAGQVLDALGISFSGFTPSEIVIRLNDGMAEIEFFEGMIMKGVNYGESKKEND